MVEVESIGKLTNEQEERWKKDYPDLYAEAIDSLSYDETTNTLYSTEFLPDFLKGLFKDPDIVISNSSEIHGQ